MGVYVTRVSSDFGNNFTYHAAYGIASPSSIETVKVMPSLLASTGSAVLLSQEGGTFANYSYVPGSANAFVFASPRYELGSTSVSNANNTPELVVVSSVLSSGSQTAWEVTSSGATYSNITPTVSVPGVAVDHRGLAMPWKSGARAAAILEFDGTRRLMVKTDIGSATTTWTNRGTLTDDANMVTYRKGDANMQELYGTDGRVWYSPDHGATIYSKNYPGYGTATPALRIDVYG